MEITPRGTLKIDRNTLATTAEGVFAGGDIAFGPRLIINAVADGQRAARGIHSYLQNVTPRLVRKGFFTPVKKTEYPSVGPLRDYMRHSRQEPATLPVNRRIGVSRVEEGYDEASAREQGSRCLICTVNPVFDGNLCILCNGCVDVCPMDCLKLVRVSEVEGNTQVAAVIERNSAKSAMLLDPARCIRCGLCAARCPTEAVRMETFRFTEEVRFEQVESGQV
jgi:formate hydrogenlyase subunit 6/NADH:ubiquinone oxidoreductase subunit I